MKKKLIATILTLSFFLCASAESFIVTSNADSGPGTLREAIEKANANGTSAVDLIYFNISDLSIAGRTIKLQSAFPDLLSNLIIDGSTQPGNKIGVSDAKIRITTPSTIEQTHIFRIINAQNISFFGLHLDDVKLNNAIGLHSAIALANAKNILIGEPSKGNYFTRLPMILREPPNGLPAGFRGMNENIAFKSNIVNLSEDGNSLVSDAFVFAFDNIRDFTIGGETEGEGNFVSIGREYIGATYTDTFANVNTGKYIIKNNKFGCNYSQTAPLPCGALYLRNGNSYGYTDTTQIIIKNNSFNVACFNFSCPMYNFIIIEGKKGLIDIKGNKFGLLNGNSDFFFSTVHTAISIAACENGIIGGDDPTDANIIAGAKGKAISLNDNQAITITKNSLYCNSSGIKVYSAKAPVPKTKIFKISDYLVQGTSISKSKIEVFLTKQCVGCDNGKLYLGNTMADDDGNWSFTSPILLDGAVTATGTSTDGVTGEFSKPEFDKSKLDYKLPTCKANNGYIRGIQFVSGTRYYWTKRWMGVEDTLFNQLDVENATQGIYSFVVEQGKYCNISETIAMLDNSPIINDQYVRLYDPSCGKNNGRIESISAWGSFNKIIWKDENETVVGDQMQLEKMFEGKYKLVVVDTIHGCGDSTSYLELRDHLGPSFNLNSMEITAASCDASNGSIKNISVLNQVGTVNIYWEDSINRIVSYSSDLINVPAGKYRLKFKDQSGCDTLVTPFQVIPNRGGITIDTLGKLITPSSCTKATGSIKNIKATGDEYYVWINLTSNEAAGTTKDIDNLAPGNYQLKVSNSLGCEKISPTVTIPQFAFDNINITNVLVKDATCDEQNGFINITDFNKGPSSYLFQWRDLSTNQVIGTSTSLFNLGAGTYVLYAKDLNECEQEIYKKQIKAITKPAFNYNDLQLRDDQCSQKSGAISNLLVNGLQGPTQYAWYDKNNNMISNTINLENLDVGTYKLKVVDNDCAVESKEFVITNVNRTLANPSYTNLTVAKYSNASFSLSNTQEGSYLLFKDAFGSQILKQSNTGQFIVGPIISDTAFFVQRIWGSCKSDLTRVNVKAVDETKIYVPTAFTPNNDGKNDVLRPTVQGIFTLHYFLIYDRWGNVIFQSNNLNKGWNGTLNSIQSPVGSYVWTIKGQDFKGNIIQQKGSFVLVR